MKTTSKMTDPKRPKRIGRGVRVGRWRRRKRDGKVIYYSYKKPPSLADTFHRHAKAIEDLHADAEQLQQEKKTLQSALESYRTTDKETIESQAMALDNYRAEISSIKATIKYNNQRDRRAEERAQTAEAKLNKVEDEGGPSCCKAHAQLLVVPLQLECVAIQMNG